MVVRLGGYGLGQGEVVNDREYACQLAHSRRTCPGIPSGPAALRVLTQLKTLLTSANVCVFLLMRENMCPLARVQTDKGSGVCVCVCVRETARD